MALHRIGLIMHGVTGRIGMNQHLARCIVEIRKQGGVLLANGDRLMPDPILVGRDEDKLRALADQYGIVRISTDLDEALANPEDSVFFDSASTLGRPAILKKAIRAGKHIYCEKPLAIGLAEALDIYETARTAGIKHGIVQDKLWVPGLMKLNMLKKAGFFGRILSVQGEFGYWVFEGDLQAAQRPSWNYRAEDGGSIILDMLCHWRYTVDHLFGPIKSVSCLGATHIPERWDEQGNIYQATADDEAYTTFMLENGAIVHINSSWCTRVRRDDLMTFQVNGTHGSAVAGLIDCWTQARVNTPRPVWNPEVRQSHNYHDDWLPVPDTMAYDNPYKAQWALFLKHVWGEGDFPWDFLEAAKGVQLMELGMQSWQERRWLDVPRLVV